MVTVSQSQPSAETGPVARPGPEVERTAAFALVRQRAEDDCTICSIAMATGLSWEDVATGAVMAPMGYVPGNGTRSTYWVLAELGFKSKALFPLQADAVKPGFVADPQRILALCIWGRRAIVTLPSLNGWKGDHDLYWDGHRLWDPSPEKTYDPDALERTDPLGVVILDERTAAIANADAPPSEEPGATGTDRGRDEP